MEDVLGFDGGCIYAAAEKRMGGALQSVSPGSDGLGSNKHI